VNLFITQLCQLPCGLLRFHILVKVKIIMQLGLTVLPSLSSGSYEQRHRWNCYV